MQDLYTEKYKALLKEMKEDPDEGKDVLCSHVGRHLCQDSRVFLLSIFGSDGYTQAQWL